ncbi:MAG: hypothetical protein PT956_01025 [Firmicutes bacterium]|nr:hypothetical protein [Ezakiella sp.]MDD7761227.1 hypothetical protein [Bacillota bacterium]
MNKLLIYLTILFLVFSLCDVVEAITSTEEDILCVSKEVEDFFNRNIHLIEPSVGNLLDLNTVYNAYWGNGFSINDISYFPYYCNGEPKLFLSIYKINNNFDWTLSPNSLIKQYFIEQIVPKIHIPDFKKKAILNQSRSSAGGVYLYLDMLEQQGSDPICACYAAASILRYIGAGNIYAKDIANFVSSGSDSEIIRYANSKNIYPTDYDGILPEQIVSYEISNDRPIYMGMKNYGDRDGWHAFVLRGYNFATNTYSIWNPWYREYAEISIYSKSISYGNDIYIWGDSIYEWR